MSLTISRSILLGAMMALATSACGGNGAVPSNTGVAGAAAAAPTDTTSILKLLTKDVEIGSTVDPKNGDTGPRAISVVKTNFGLKKGQVLVCNFEDSAGTAGMGTTIEVLDPTPGSAPATFAQNTKLEGCDGDAVTSGNDVYGAGLTSGLVSEFNQAAKFKKNYGSPIQAPFADADAYCGEEYAPEGIYIGDSKTGSIIKLAFPISSSGHAQVIQVITGFGVNTASGWSTLGPSGIQYDGKKTGSICNDSLYIVDGVDNTVIAVSNASNLLVKNEIVVQPGGKTFKCLDKKETCATLVYSGAPLDAPVASALLPNGNLIIANTGNNMLVEMTPKGKVLDTKVVDTSKTPGIFGLAAIGTKDSNTALFYTDTNTNTLQELEQ
jgi:hypothetical protein